MICIYIIIHLLLWRRLLQGDMGLRLFACSLLVGLSLLGTSLLLAPPLCLRLRLGRRGNRLRDRKTLLATPLSLHLSLLLLLRLRSNPSHSIMHSVIFSQHCCTPSSTPRCRTTTCLHTPHPTPPSPLLLLLHLYRCWLCSSCCHWNTPSSSHHGTPASTPSHHPPSTDRQTRDTTIVANPIVAAPASMVE